MSKFTDAIKAAIKANFEAGKTIKEVNIQDWLDKIQAGIQEHEHVPTGGAGTGTGDALPITHVDAGADANKPTEPSPGQVYVATDTGRVYACYTAGAWTRIDAGAAPTVPSGAICMFMGSCPDGWTRVTELDGKFPRGAASYGGSGGAETHEHSFSGTTGSYEEDVETGEGVGYATGTHSHSFSGQTAAASHLPPYLDMVFCKKD